MSNSATTTESSLGCTFFRNVTATTSAADAAAAAAAAWWAAGLRWTQVAMSTLGLAGNSLVVATLARRRYQSRFATAVFLHQTAVDLFVCAFTLVIILKPDQNPSDSRSLGFVLCHVLNSQLFYWYSVFASVQNLLLIAVDRYWAVFRPVRYKTLGWKPAAICLAGLHAYSFLVNVIDVFSVEFDSARNMCSSEITSAVWKRVFKVYGFVWFGLVYLAPVTGVVCMYAGIVCRLSGRGSLRSAAAAGRFRRRAATDLTKSAVVITGIFIVCFSYDCVYYLLGHLDLVQYVYNSPTQLIGVFLVTLNSCANPVVYCIVMRSFRARIVAAVCCCDIQGIGRSFSGRQNNGGGNRGGGGGGGVDGDGAGRRSDSDMISVARHSCAHGGGNYQRCSEDDGCCEDEDFDGDETEASLEPHPIVSAAVSSSPLPTPSESPTAHRMSDGLGLGFCLGFSFSSRARLLEPPIEMKELQFQMKPLQPQ